MKHILNLLDNKCVDRLTEDERAIVLEHIGHCSECHVSYEASRLATIAARERAAVIVEPSPFFHTRVLAAVREARAVDEVPVLTRLWRSAGLLASSMAATVLTLAVLTFYAPATQTDLQPSQLVADNVVLSAEDVIFPADDGAENVSDAEVLDVLYNGDTDNLR